MISLRGWLNRVWSSFRRRSLDDRLESEIELHLSELRALKTGIERTDNVFVAYPTDAYPGAYDGIDNDTYYPQVLRRIEALPGVGRPAPRC